MARLTMLKPRVAAMRPDRVAALTTAVQRPKTAAWDAARADVIERDRGLCVRCPEAGRVSLGHEVDHKVPLWQGGEALERSNLQLLCRACHAEKSALEARQRAAWGSDGGGGGRISGGAGSPDRMVHHGRIKSPL